MAEARAHIVHLLASFELGAAQYRVARLIAGLEDRYRHTVISLDRRVGARSLIPAALDVGVIGPLAAWGSPVALRRLLAMLRPDLLVVDAQSLRLARIAGWNRGTSLVLTVESGADLERAPGPKPLFRQLARAAAALVVPDRALVGEVAEAVRLHPARITVVADGAEPLDRSRPPGAPDAIRGPGEIVIGALVGSSGGDRPDVLLRAFAAAPHRRSARFVVGGPPGALAGEAEGLGIADRVVFHGEIGDPAEAVAGFDIFAVATAGGGVPFGLLDAMASGLPVIASGDRVLASLLGAANRDFVLDPEAPAPLTARLDALLHSTQLRRRLGRANRERAESRPFSRTVAGWRKVFDRCLGEVED